MKQHTLLLRLEAIWWLITFIVILVILLPILTKLPDYPFWGDNLLFIIVFITFTRLIFLLPYSLIAKQQYVKAGLIFLCMLIAFILIQKVTQFKIYMDENGADAIVGSLARADQKPLMNFIRTEMMLFGIGSVVSCILLPFRLMGSIWRQINDAR